MRNFIIVLTLLFVVQLAFSYFQVRYYNTFVRNVAKKYQGMQGYKLVSDVAKKWSLSVVVLAVIDAHDSIVELYYFKGLTIFSRFKVWDDYIGRELDDELLQDIQQHQKTIQDRALLNLVQKEMKTISNRNEEEEV